MRWPRRRRSSGQRGAAAMDDDFMPQSFGCFGRSLSRASSDRRLEYRALSGEGGEEIRRIAQEERSAREAGLADRDAELEVVARE